MHRRPLPRDHVHRGRAGRLPVDGHPQLTRHRHDHHDITPQGLRQQQVRAPWAFPWRRFSSLNYPFFERDVSSFFRFWLLLRKSIAAPLEDYSWTYSSASSCSLTPSLPLFFAQTHNPRLPLYFVTPAGRRSGGRRAPGSTNCPTSWRRISCSCPSSSSPPLSTSLSSTL